MVTWAWLHPGYQLTDGTAMTTIPLLGEVALHGMRESQNWWFKNMANGSEPAFPAKGGGGFAPDGTMCDNGEPTGCNYKQGDGNVPIHDWTLEETLSGLVMQAEMLLVRTAAAAASRRYLPPATSFNPRLCGTGCDSVEAFDCVAPCC